MCRVHPWPVGSVGGVEGSAAAAGDLRRSDGLKLHEASDDQGSQCPDDVLAVQQVRLEGAQQDVPLDAVVGDGLQDQVLPGTQPRRLPAGPGTGGRRRRHRPGRVSKGGVCLLAGWRGRRRVPLVGRSVVGSPGSEQFSGHDRLPQRISQSISAIIASIIVARNPLRQAVCRCADERSSGSELVSSAGFSVNNG